MNNEELLKMLVERLSGTEPEVTEQPTPEPEVTTVKVTESAMEQIRQEIATLKQERDGYKSQLDSIASYKTNKKKQDTTDKEFLESILGGK